LAERLLRGVALGQIAGELGKADELALVAEQAVDDDIGPEAAAVLAHAPALGLEPALGERRLERALRHAQRLVLRRVQHREMLPDGFVGAVKLDARGAEIPRAD